jgi:hypothetical protein
MHLKYAPRLKFVSDETFAEADRIERLIDRELGHVRSAGQSQKGDDEHGA